MKPKEIVFEEEARSALKNGIDQLADVVAITLGPRGRNVGLQSYSSPTITSDGHSIAKDLELKDPLLNLGVSMGKEVAAKIKEKAGDGTTTGIVLLRALVSNGVKQIASGASPIGLKREMDQALEQVLKEIDAMSKKVEEIRNIATVSASGNSEIGEKIAACFEKVGKNGVITIEEGKGTETKIEIVEGMQLDRGFLSAYFANEMHHAHILITDKKISSAQEILPILQHAATTGQELFIIADDVEGEALSTLVINKLRGTLKVAAIKAPGFGDRRKAILEDLAILTGADLVTEEKGMSLREAGADVLGRADKVLIDKEKTTIIGGKGSPKAIQARIAQIGDDPERKGKLSGGVAVIQVGAPTESEMKKKKQMFEDSLNSTRAALEEGVVVGGGVALLRAARASIKGKELGAQILLKACEAPFRQIVSNTGYDSSIVLGEVMEKGAHFGFNALTEKVEDLLKSGVIDPAKVVKSSLSHAVSVAGMVLLSEAVISS
jgi:chaperonin GroEL